MKNKYGYRFVDLPANQYISFNAFGDELGSRATRAHELNGGSIEFNLRETTVDGIGITLQVTPAQLAELGYTRDDDLDDLFARSIIDEEEIEEEPARFAYCTKYKGMVNPSAVSHSEFGSECLEVFCKEFGWVPAGQTAGDIYDDDYMRHAFDEECIDKTAVR